jgi:hypothetical protein
LDSSFAGLCDNPCAIRAIAFARRTPESERFSFLASQDVFRCRQRNAAATNRAVFGTSAARDSIRIHGPGKTVSAKIDASLQSVALRRIPSMHTCIWRRSGNRYRADTSYGRFARYCSTIFCRVGSPGNRTGAVGRSVASFISDFDSKESFVKATGEGLGRPLDQFAVLMGPEEPSIELIGTSESAHNWKLQSFCPAPGYVGGVAVQGGPIQMRWYAFEHEAMDEGE